MDGLLPTLHNDSRVLPVVAVSVPVVVMVVVVVTVMAVDNDYLSMGCRHRAYQHQAGKDAE